MNSAGFLEARDREVILALHGVGAAQRVQALCHAGMPAPEHARADRHGLLGELTRFGQLAGVAAEEREIVGALRVIGRLDPQFAFAKFESLP